MIDRQCSAYGCQDSYLEIQALLRQINVYTYRYVYIIHTLQVIDTAVLIVNIPNFGITTTNKTTPFIYVAIIYRYTLSTLVAHK